MKKGFRRPILGEYRKLDLSRGGIVSTAISVAELKGLTQYLDRAAGDEESKQVLAILEDMLELEKLQSPSWGEAQQEIKILHTSTGKGELWRDPRLKSLVPEKFARQTEIEERKASINLRLRRYRFAPMVHRSGDTQWAVIWQLQFRSKRQVKIKEGVFEINDGLALQRVLDLARAGYLNRLRRCSNCTKWLFANFRHQNYCSQGCQQKHYSQSPDWKRKRRDYMRRYRQQTT